MTRAAAWAVRVAVPAVALGVVSALLTGCGASPAKLGPTGVDGLVVPTPSPDAADFAGESANAWFPLVAGTRWTYRQDTPTSHRTVVAEVRPGHPDIAGVATTPVRWQVVSGGTTRTALVRWYAVDRAGNVWWFGQRVTAAGRHLDPLATRSFRVGLAGAEAGLVLSAAPRVGDGYFNARQPHVVERRSTVISLTGTVATSNRTFRDTVITRDLSALAPLHTVQTYFARGIGIVAQQDTTSVSASLALVRVSRG
jgi:hypothetical protein